MRKKIVINKKIGIVLGAAFIFAGAGFIGLTFLSIKYLHSYSLAVFLTGVIMLFSGPFLLIFPGANVRLTKDGDDVQETVKWWNESSRAHHILWISVLVISIFVALYLGRYLKWLYF
jgi:hypothetical protein